MSLQAQTLSAISLISLVYSPAPPPAGFSGSFFPPPPAFSSFLHAPKASSAATPTNESIFFMVALSFLPSLNLVAQPLGPPEFQPDLSCAGRRRAPSPQ